jgi:hypothetical protein
MLGCYGISTYDYVVNQRMDETVNQTLSQFNQLRQNPSSPTKQSKFNFQKVLFEILFIYLFILFLFFRDEEVIK